MKTMKYIVLLSAICAVALAQDSMFDALIDGTNLLEEDLEVKEGSTHHMAKMTYELVGNGLADYDIIDGVCVNGSACECTMCTDREQASSQSGGVNAAGLPQDYASFCYERDSGINQAGTDAEAKTYCDQFWGGSGTNDYLAAVFRACVAARVTSGASTGELRCEAKSLNCCAPTSAPTPAPTLHPTLDPTRTPTTTPTNLPTNLPTTTPTNLPTDLPTTSPTNLPTETPTQTPTLIPTM
jgi:hypothetical protein